MNAARVASLQMRANTFRDRNPKLHAELLMEAFEVIELLDIAEAAYLWREEHLNETDPCEACAALLRVLEGA